MDIGNPKPINKDPKIRAQLDLLKHCSGADFRCSLPHCVSLAALLC